MSNPLTDLKDEIIETLQTSMANTAVSEWIPPASITADMLNDKIISTSQNQIFVYFDKATVQYPERSDGTKVRIIPTKTVNIGIIIVTNRTSTDISSANADGIAYEVEKALLYEKFTDYNENLIYMDESCRNYGGMSPRIAILQNWVCEYEIKNDYGE